MCGCVGVCVKPIKDGIIPIRPNGNGHTLTLKHSHTNIEGNETFHSFRRNRCNSKESDRTHTHTHTKKCILEAQQRSKVRADTTSTHKTDFEIIERQGNEAQSQ